MAVTLPYKIALGASSAMLLLAVVMRLQTGGDTIDPSASQAQSDAATLPGAAPPTTPDGSDAQNGAAPSIATSDQAPSKAPPSVTDDPSSAGDASADASLRSVLFGDSDATPYADSAMGSDAVLEVPPTLTVGRTPGQRAADLVGQPSSDGVDPLAALDPGDEDAPTAAELISGSTVSDTTGPTYTVRTGDTFEAIARRELGSSSQWVALAKANPTVDPLKLRVGDVLRLPAEASEDLTPLALPADGTAMDPQTATLPPPPQPVTYVVRSGDSLSTIAARFYADSSRWQAIFNANRDQLKDPHAVKIGMELRIPPAVAAAPGSVQ